MNIEHSFSGRIELPTANKFIMEAVQLVVNSMELFKDGYFDFRLRDVLQKSRNF